MRRTLTVLAAAAIWSALSVGGICQDPPSTVVTSCRTDVEQGAGNNLASAILAAQTTGAPVRFECPTGTTIAMTVGHVIFGRVIIDGENKVTLDAVSQTRFPIFDVQEGGAFSLHNLTAKRSQLDVRPGTDAAPGALINSDGPVQLQNVVIQDSVRPVATRKGLLVLRSNIRTNVGPVLVAGGDAIIVDSTFVANKGAATLSVQGRMDLTNSQFFGNQEAVLARHGLIKGSLFQGNEYLIGGELTGDLSVVGSTFDANPGSIVLNLAKTVPSRILFRKNIFTSNSGQLLYLLPRGGGADAPPSTVEFSRNRFLGNKGVVAGALTLYPDAGVKVSITANIFVNNESQSTGGAINWTGSDVTITNNLFKDNRAKNGGALYGRYKLPGGKWIIANSLIAGNTALPDSGAIDVTEASLFNVTVARNDSFGLVFAGEASDVVVANTIFSDNKAGNCKGVSTSAFKRGNLQFGARDCGNAMVVDPQLDELFVPALASQALLSGDIGICKSAPVNRVDVIFQRRDDGARCTSGAYERAPITAVTKKVHIDKTCPGGTKVAPSVPCPEEVKVCPSGDTIPAAATCTDPPQQCPDGTIVPAGLSCRMKLCPGGTVVAVTAQCPPDCPAGCSGTYPNCQCPCPSPCTGTRPNCACPCQQQCNCRPGSGCSPSRGALGQCSCNLPGQTPVPERYCVGCVN